MGGMGHRARLFESTPAFPCESRAVLLLFCLPLLAAQAHDIPNARVDRSIQVNLDPGASRLTTR